MNPLTIYHNPRCRKSREALQWLKDHHIPHRIRLYLKEPLSDEELQQLIRKLQDPVEALIRSNEKVFKEHFKGMELTPESVRYMIVQHPHLMQRPIVATDKSAIVARPAERIRKLIE